MRRWAVPILFLAVLGCGGSSSGSGKRCLTDDEICQFQAGVSTTTDVRAALGNPQISQSVGGSGGGIQ